MATSVEPTSLAQAQLEPQWLESSIQCWCGRFVFINHGRIYLIHQTAKEFLISGSSSSTSLSRWKHCLDLRGVETEITRICVEFLCLEDVWPTAQSLSNNSSVIRKLATLWKSRPRSKSFSLFSRTLAVSPTRSMLVSRRFGSIPDSCILSGGQQSCTISVCVPITVS
jgi:hypothetical protein